MKLAAWFAGFFEDQKGFASSKRATLYVSLFFFYLLIQGSLDGKIIDAQVLFMTTGLILFCIGAVTSEYFSKQPKKEDKPTDEGQP